jgi:hypothetical protein
MPMGVLGGEPKSPPNYNVIKIQDLTPSYKCDLAVVKADPVSIEQRSCAAQIYVSLCNSGHHLRRTFQNVPHSTINLCRPHLDRVRSK